jgi:ubiquitin carboxyl-terminal hydrolase L5
LSQIQDGLKSGPLEVGELENSASTEDWMKIVRPVIKLKMRKYGGDADGENIRFNLLALVDDQYQTVSDELELLKREKRQLERRLDQAHPGGWSDKV